MIDAIQRSARVAFALLCPFIILLTLASLPAPAQVVSPIELNDPKLQRLQQRHFRTLVDIAGEIQRYKYPYPFYLSRVLDVDIAKMKDVDQRSIRFDSYKGETVLELTGNYYASYNAESMDGEARLKTTFEQVIVPILKIEVPRFPDDSEFASFAFEVSHHVREKIMGVRQEHAENVTVIIPVTAAQKFVDAKSDDQKQSAVLEARIFLNGQPYALWVHEGPPPEDWQDRYAPPSTKKQPPESAAAPNQPAAPSTGVSPNLLKPAPAPIRILTPEALANLQSKHRDEIDRMVKSLDKEAHFVPYAPPSFIGFRQKRIDYSPDERAHGTTSWNTRALLGLSVEALTSFSVAPLRLASLLGLLLAAAAFIFGLQILIETFVFGQSVPGYPSLVVGLMVLGGGFAGATCARMLRRADPLFDVALVEANPIFTACPFSNAVIVGLRDVAAQALDIGLARDIS